MPSHWLFPSRPADEEAPLPEVGEQDSAAFNPVEISRALTALPSDNYNDWIAVGQALHSTGHPLARGLWDWWSGQSTKYNQAAQDTKWKTFTKDGGRTLGDLYTLAHQHGWRPAGWGQEQPESINHVVITEKGTPGNPHEIRPKPFTTSNTLRNWPTTSSRFHRNSGTAR